MAKFVKVILSLLFVVAFNGAVNDFSVVEQAERQIDAICVMTLDQTTSGSVIGVDEPPYLPEAELLNNCALTYQITMSRIQRVNVAEYVLSLKGLVQTLANRVAALSQHFGRIYDTTTSYYCHPSSNYYVFALRRIII